MSHWAQTLGWSVHALLKSTDLPVWKADLNELGVSCSHHCDPSHFDLVLINTLIDIPYVDELFGRLPIVLWIHEGLSPTTHKRWMQQDLRGLFSKPDLLIFQTPWQSEKVFSKMLAQVPPERIATITCGVEGLIRSSSLKLPHSDIHVVSLGSVYPRKRPLDLAEAVVALSERTDLRATFIGDLSYASKLGARFDELKEQYPELLTWTGGISEAEKLECLSAADIACFPSGDETFGISAVEAASLGLPIILADLPVYAYVGWVNEQNCLLYPVGDISALQRCIQRLIDQPALRETLGRAAQDFSRQFGMQEFLTRFTETVQTAVNRSAFFKSPSLLAAPPTTRPAMTSRDILQQQLQQNPNDHAGWHALALSAFEAGQLNQAIQFLDAAIALAPKVALYQRNLGEICRRAGQWERAMAAGRKACKLAPKDLDAHYNLGLAYTDAKDFPHALKCYRQALKLNPRHNLSWNNLGSALEQQGDKAGALDAYENAIAIEPGHAEAQNNAGAIYSEQGRLDEARTAFEAAIAARPGFTEAHHNLCSLKRYTADDPHLPMLRQLYAQRETLPLASRIRVNFALGKALDDLGDTDAAFAAYAEGNRLQHGLLPMDEALADVRLQGILQTFDADFFARRAGGAPAADTDPTRTPIFIVGMPRSGTTLLEQILCSHPSVHGAGELLDLHEAVNQATGASAERPFYEGVVTLSAEDLARIGRDYLQRVWKLSPESQFITDKMPANFFYLGLIHLALPGAKIIHAMRDPMDSCFSCYSRLFNDTMEFAYDQGTLGRYYGRYMTLMRHWHAVLPAGTLLDLRYEDMVADTEGQARRVLDFVGLPWDDNCLKFHENPRLVKTASVSQVRQPIYTSSLARWRRFAPHLTPLLRLVRDYRDMTAADEALLEQVNVVTPTPTTHQPATSQPPGPHPQEAEALHVRGIEHYRADRFAEALADYDRALDLQADFPGCLNSKGFLLQDLGHMEEALACFEQAVTLAPEMAMARLNLGMAQLKLGDWANGWKNYEARWTGSAEAANGSFARPACPLPHWTGDTGTENDRILILTEQGFGDTFQFVRYLPLLAQRFAKVGFACSVPTQRLIEWSFGDQVFTLHRMPTEPEGFAGWDWQCALMSLPLAFDTLPDSIPGAAGYLRVPDPVARHWRERLEDAAPQRFRVGLAWAGRKGHQYDRRRSLAFEQLQPLLSESRITWVSLQKWAPEDQRPNVPATVDWIDWTDELTDFADTAGLVSQLDWVLSVDSSMVHLVGALGRPVWMMDRFDNEWRWLRDRTDSPWYAGLRIFRQPRFGDWESIIAKVGAALSQLPALAESATILPRQRVPRTAPAPANPAAAAPPAPGQPIGMSVEQALQQASQWQAAGRLQEAEQLLQQILQAQPRQAHALHLLGVIAYQAQQPARALEFIRQAIEIEPHVALFHSNFAEMNRQQGRLDEALAHGEKAVALEPSMASGHSNLGVAWYDAGDYDRAEACHQQALALAPQLLQSLNNLGSIVRARKNKALAAEYYRRALSIQPDYLESLSNLGAVLVEDERADEAEAPLERALQLQPNYPEALCNLGLVRLKQDRNEEAAGLLQRSLQLRPHYPEAMVGLARVWQALDQLDQAGELLTQLVTVQPDKADAWSLLGAVRTESGDTDGAETAFQQALVLDPGMADALTGLGHLRMEQGDLDEAARLLDQAIEADADNLAARFHRIQVNKVQPDDPNLVALESKVSSIPELGSDKTISLHYALGKAYDDLKRWDDAFPHFLEGARLKRAKLDYDPAAEAERIDRLIAQVDRDFITRLEGAGDPTDLPVFVLGMPRSGTTLTEQIIASHPEVHGAGELRYLMEIIQQPGQAGSNDWPPFPDNLAGLTPARLTEWGSAYHQRLNSHDGQARRITDKMPANYLALGIIPLMLPSARIIHVRRNPIDTCVSCFTRLFNRHQEATYDLFELGRHYANYARLMAHWRSVLPADRFLEVNYEDIVADQPSQARGLIDWVGLEWDDACLDFHKTQRNIRTASVTQVRQPIYASSVERWRQYEKYLEPLLEGLGGLVGEANLGQPLFTQVLHK